MYIVEETIMGKKRFGEEPEEDIYQDKSTTEFKHLDPYCEGKFVEEYDAHFHCPRCGSWYGEDIQQEHGS